jgi:hypothetical protein
MTCMGVADCQLLVAAGEQQTTAATGQQLTTSNQKFLVFRWTTLHNFGHFFSRLSILC